MMRVLEMDTYYVSTPEIPATPLLPVRVTDAREARRRPVRRRRSKDLVHARGTRAAVGSIDIELVGGVRVHVHGEAASDLLKQLVDQIRRP